MFAKLNSRKSIEVPEKRLVTDSAYVREDAQEPVNKIYRNESINNVV